MKKLLILFYFILISQYFFAQKITLSGQVKDSLENPLPYANVIAKPKQVSKNMQFAISDNEGFYKLVLQKNDAGEISRISKIRKKRFRANFVFPFSTLTYPL